MITWLLARSMGAFEKEELKVIAAIMALTFAGCFELVAALLILKKLLGV